MYVRETAITLDTVERSEAGANTWFGGFSDAGRYRCFVAVRGGRLGQSPPPQCAGRL